MLLTDAYVWGLQRRRRTTSDSARTKDKSKLGRGAGPRSGAGSMAGSRRGRDGHGSHLQDQLVVRRTNPIFDSGESGSSSSRGEDYEVGCSVCDMCCCEFFLACKIFQSSEECVALYDLLAVCLAHFLCKLWQEFADLCCRPQHQALAVYTSCLRHPAGRELLNAGISKIASSKRLP